MVSGASEEASAFIIINSPGRPDGPSILTLYIVVILVSWPRLLCTHVRSCAARGAPERRTQGGEGRVRRSSGAIIQFAQICVSVYSCPRNWSIHGEGWTSNGVKMTSSSVKYSVFRALQLLSLFTLLFANVSIYAFYFSFSLKPLWKFYNDNFCEHFAFYSGHLFPHFCEANLAATDEKVNFVRSCQPKLVAAAFVFLHPSCGCGARSPRALWLMPLERVKLESWNPATKLGQGEMMRWGGGGKRTEYEIQLQPTPCILFPSQQAKVSP